MISKRDHKRLFDLVLIFPVEFVFLRKGVLLFTTTVEWLEEVIELDESLILLMTLRVLLKCFVLEINDVYDEVQLLVILEFCNLATSKII